MKQEGEYWDFKRQWYSKKEDMLHDIICMANNLTINDGYIIIGVDEENDYLICDVANDSNRRKTQDIVTFLRDKNFAGDIRPTVYIETLSVKDKLIDVIVVQNDRNTPYYLTKPHGKLFANNIYSRLKDTNTPKDSSADINVVEKLWKKRFGLDASALERVKIYLQNSQDWTSNKTGKIFYKYAPEFTIEKLPKSNSRHGYVFYMFKNRDTNPNWYEINIYYHQTLLCSMGGVYLDGTRYFTSTPLVDGICLDLQNQKWDVSYQYFIKGSMEYIVHQFFITDEDEEPSVRHHFLECVLIFEDEYEKEQFDCFIFDNYRNYNEDDYKERIPNIPEIKWLVVDVIRENFLQAFILKKMLSDFRAHKNF